jgi:hypothetical protein
MPGQTAPHRRQCNLPVHDSTLLQRPLIRPPRLDQLAQGLPLFCGQLLLFGFTLGGVRVASAHQIAGRDLGGGARVLFLEPWPGAQRLALRAIDTRLGEQKDPALAAAGADS